MGGRNLREKGERTEKIEGENLGERGRKSWGKGGGN